MSMTWKPKRSSLNRSVRKRRKRMRTRRGRNPSEKEHWWLAAFSRWQWRLGSLAHTVTVNTMVFVCFLCVNDSSSMAWLLIGLTVNIQFTIEEGKCYPFPPIFSLQFFVSFGFWVRVRSPVPQIFCKRSIQRNPNSFQMSTCVFLNFRFKLSIAKSLSDIMVCPLNANLQPFIIYYK